MMGICHYSACPTQYYNTHSLVTLTEMENVISNFYQKLSNVLATSTRIQTLVLVRMPSAGGLSSAMAVPDQLGEYCTDLGP